MINKCCALALVSLISVDFAHAGALKSFFVKDKAAEHINPDATKAEEKSEAAGANSEATEPAKADEAKTEEPASSEPAPAETAPVAVEETQKKIEGDPVVIKIGKEEIRRSRILAEIQKLPPQIVKSANSTQLFTMARDQLASTIAMEKHAKKIGLDKTKEFVERLDELKTRLMIDALLAKETGAQPTEAALKARYTKYLVEFVKRKENCVFNIIVDDEKKCKELIEKLKRGADFKKLAKENSLYKEKADEGSWFAIDTLPEQLQAPLKKLKNGEFSKEPVKFGNVWAIFKLDGVRDSEPLKYEDAKNLLTQLIVQEKLRDFMLSTIKKYDVKVFKEDGSADVFMSAAQAK